MQKLETIRVRGISSIDHALLLGVAGTIESGLRKLLLLEPSPFLIILRPESQVQELKVA